MLAPRWRKILRDLWSNKARTILVILSIAIGVAAIGMVAGTYSVITVNLPTQYEKVVPAHTVFSMAPFDDDLVNIIRAIDGVKQAEGRYKLQVRLKIGPDEWRDLNLTVISNFNDMQMRKVFPTRGIWPPGYRGIIFERTSLPLTNAKMGDTILVETPEGIQRQLKITGLAHDLNIPSSSFTNQINGFIDFETLKWLGHDQLYNELLITSDGLNLTREKIRDLSLLIEEKIEKGGKKVFYTTIPPPDQHWFVPYLVPMATILSIIGLVVLVISCFLIINTISAILTQQTRQIGIMKAVGGRSGQILMMYLASIFIVGIIAFLIAIPIGLFGMRFFVNIISTIINFNLERISLPSQVIWYQGIISIVLPIIVTFIPIKNASNITIRSAISDYGLNNFRFGVSLFDRLLGTVQGFSRPVLLSLRNTFRRKTRLLFTLITLSLGSAIFIGVMSVYASLINTLDDALDYYGFDLVVFFNKDYRIEQILKEISRVPEVAIAETWGIAEARIVNEDGSESNSISFVSPPTNTKLIKPSVIKGRWLSPEDENAIVINTDVLQEKPDLDVGHQVKLMVDGVESLWEIVGITRSVMTGPWIYTNYPYFTRRLGRYGLSSGVYVALDQHGPNSQIRMAKVLEDHFERGGLRVNSVGKVMEFRSSAISQFNVILIFLMIMTFMLALVGGLGLAGTMSMNVMERIREIGVLRAIGASNISILQIVMIEGILIGILSWFIGLIISIPISTLLSNAIGQGFLRSPLENVFSYTGAFIWLFIVIVISGLASLLPAFNAIRITVRDVLAYE